MLMCRLFATYALWRWNACVILVAVLWVRVLAQWGLGLLLLHYNLDMCQWLRFSDSLSQASKSTTGISLVLGHEMYFRVMSSTVLGSFLSGSVLWELGPVCLSFHCQGLKASSVIGWISRCSPHKVNCVQVFNQSTLSIKSNHYLN